MGAHSGSRCVHPEGLLACHLHRQQLISRQSMRIGLTKARNNPLGQERVKCTDMECVLTKYLAFVEGLLSITKTFIALKGLLSQSAFCLLRQMISPEVASLLVFMSHQPLLPPPPHPLSRSPSTSTSWTLAPPSLGGHLQPWSPTWDQTDQSFRGYAVVLVSMSWSLS